MSFDSKKTEFSRERIDVVEIDLDFCSLNFGISPCAATGAGDAKCHNTFASCQDTANYDGGKGGKVFGIRIDVDGTAFTFKRFDGGSFIGDGMESGSFVTALGFKNSANNNTFEIDSLTDDTIGLEPSSGVVDETLTFTGSLDTKNAKTYRFCTSRSPHPVGIDAIPSISSVSVSPSVIDVKGGLGVRSSASVTLVDHPSSDIDIDPYYDERTYDPLERGTFWTKLRARNPDYQFRDMRVLSGYLNDDGSYDAANFQTRHYVINSLSVSNGTARLTAKDPLKLASAKKAQVPAPSTGSLSASLTAVATTATLIPAGVGNLEYAASGKVLINKEVMSFTRLADVLTLTRAQNNTVATTHAINGTVQQCYEMRLDPNGRVDEIVKDLLINFLGINSSFINASVWATETDNYLSYLLDGIIVKPTDVNKILKELSQAAPHYLWWDERSRKIQFTALKAPPSTTAALNSNDNIINLSTSDKTEMRVSTVFINYGQFNPVEKLDDVGNYQQSYVRIDTDSIAKYKSNSVETISSRWINSANKSGAKKLSEMIGRRFSDIPRAFNFSLDAKDSDGSNGLWVGKNIALNHRDVTDFSGLSKDVTVQITSASEADDYKFSAIEYTYGGVAPDDEADATEVIYFSANETNVNLYDKFNSVFGTPTATTVAIFVVELGAVIGSTSTSTPAIEMGDWSSIPAGFSIEIQIDAGCFITGKGGDGGNQIIVSTPGTGGGNGGLALNITENCTIINNGVIGGGGGGGAGGDSGGISAAGGGGGAGGASSLAGSFGVGGYVNGGNGETELGGLGGTLGLTPGGNGGNLGVDGTTNSAYPAGSAGAAIDENLNTVTYSTAGDIRGAIL